MSEADAIRGTALYLGETGALKRFIPEPTSALSNQFGTLVRALGSAALQGVTGLEGLNPEYQALIQKQIELQEQLMMVSMSSNLERTQHETRMAAVRNLRAA